MRARELVFHRQAFEPGDADEILAELPNLALLEPWIKAEQPVVLLASHHCNWEWLLLTSCIELGISVDAVYKPLRVGAVDRFMLAARSRFGGNPIPVKNFLMEVMKRRKGARIIALVADQTPLATEEKQDRKSTRLNSSH